MAPHGSSTLPSPPPPAVNIVNFCRRWMGHSKSRSSSPTNHLKSCFARSPISSRRGLGLTTCLPNLKFLNLSSNQLLGPIPDTFRGLILLQNVSFSANSMSCSLPDSMIDIPSLVHLDLSSNQFNGSVSKFLSEMCVGNPTLQNFWPSVTFH